MSVPLLLLMLDVDERMRRIEWATGGAGWVRQGADGPVCICSFSSACCAVLTGLVGRLRSRRSRGRSARRSSGGLFLLPLTSELWRIYPAYTAAFLSSVSLFFCSPHCTLHRPRICTLCQICFCTTTAVDFAYEPTPVCMTPHACPPHRLCCLFRRVDTSDPVLLYVLLPAVCANRRV